MKGSMILLVVAPLYISWRVMLAARLPISDCDEVYNYWEPLHFVLYGTGLQTWEYAHEYALRTYAYVVPLQWIAQSILQPLLLLFTSSSSSSMSSSSILRLLSDHHEHEQDASNNNKAAIFVLLRALLAALTASTEVLWLYALAKAMTTTRSSNNGDNNSNSSNVVIACATALVLLTCTGMNHSAAAYLPSATWISVWCAAAASFLLEHHYVFVAVSVTATLSTGWPFGAVSVVPMALHILYKEYCNCGAGHSLLRLLAFIVAVTVVVQGTVMGIDYQYYGIWTSPTLNIFNYNAGNSGDELYGVEPFSYYVKNLLLNLNVAAALGVMALPVYLFLPSLQQQQQNNKLRRAQINWNVVSMLLCLPAWFAVTVPRPHKEERFLFPVYPVLVFGAVLTVDTVLTRIVLPLVTPKPVLQEREATKQERIRMFLHAILWVPVVLISLSRTAALQTYYSGPMAVYTALSPPKRISQDNSSSSAHLVCTCGEWYRFPSSFYLPDGVELGFLPSSFTGQLPQAFSKHGSDKKSQSLLQPFNDRNLEQKERYVQDILSCGWIVDLADGECVSQLLENTTTGSSSSAKAIASFPFLDGERTATIHRTLYLPFWHEKAQQTGQVTYQDYVLYQIDHHS